MEAYADTLLFVEGPGQSATAAGLGDGTAIKYMVGYTPILTKHCSEGPLQATVTLACDLVTSAPPSSSYENRSLSAADRAYLKKTLGFDLEPYDWLQRYGSDLTQEERNAYLGLSDWMTDYEDAEEPGEEVWKLRDLFASFDYAVRQRYLERYRHALPSLGLMERDRPARIASSLDAYGSRTEHAPPSLKEPDEIIQDMLRDEFGYQPKTSGSVPLSAIRGDSSIEVDGTCKARRPETEFGDSGYGSNDDDNVVSADDDQTADLQKLFKPLQDSQLFNGMGGGAMAGM